MLLHARAKYVLTIVALFVIGAWAVSFAFNEAHRHAVLTTDSIIYVDTARHIAAEKRIATNILSLDATAAPEPQTQWPPFYSLTMAPLIAAGIEPIFAGRIISAAAFGLTVFLVGAWAWRLAGRLAGIAAAALLTALPGVSSIAAAVWADSLYTLIVTAFAWLGTETIGSRSAWRWLILGIIVGVGITTKYLGLLLFGPLLLFAGLAYWRHRRWKTSLIQFGSAAAGSLLLIVPLLVRNLVSGKPLGGAGRPISTQPLTEIFGDSWSTLSGDFTASLIWSGVIVLSATSVFVIMQRRRPAKKLETLTIIAGVALLYWLGLVAARALIDTDDIYTRFTMPVYPLAVIALTGLITTAAAFFGGRTSQALAAILIVSGALWTIRAYDFSAQAWSPNISERTRIVETRTTPSDLIIGNGSREYALFLGRSVMQLPANSPSRQLTPEFLSVVTERWAQQVDRILIALTPELHPEEYGEYAAALSRGAISAWKPIFASPAIILYEVSSR